MPLVALANMMASFLITLAYLEFPMGGVRFAMALSTTNIFFMWVLDRCSSHSPIKDGLRKVFFFANAEWTRGKPNNKRDDVDIDTPSSHRSEIRCGCTTMKRSPGPTPTTYADGDCSDVPSLCAEDSYSTETDHQKKNGYQFHGRILHPIVGHNPTTRSLNGMWLWRRRSGDFVCSRQ